MSLDQKSEVKYPEVPGIVYCGKGRIDEPSPALSGEPVSGLLRREDPSCRDPWELARLPLRRGTLKVLGVAYPSQTRPKSTHLLHAGFSSPHLTLRALR